MDKILALVWLKKNPLHLTFTFAAHTYRVHTCKTILSMALDGEKRFLSKTLVTSHNSSFLTESAKSSV